MKKCIGCLKEKPLSEFYSKGGQRGQYQSWCKPCYVQRTTARQQATRLRAVEYLGGRCQICEYSRCVPVLEFHHLDRSHKDPQFHNMKSWSWTRIEKELAGCVLLCSNCHGEVENGFANLEG